MKILAAMLLTFSLAVAGCATHEQTGTTLGAAAGGALGHEITGGSFVGTLVGAFVGAAVGGEIGRQMDEQDRRLAAYALETQPTGEPYDWVNPDTGYRYSVTPERTYRGARGPCRDFSVLTYIEGRPTEVHGTACRHPDGSWRTVE